MCSVPVGHMLGMPLSYALSDNGLAVHITYMLLANRIFLTHTFAESARGQLARTADTPGGLYYRDGPEL